MLHLTRDTPAGRVHLCQTERADGDVAIGLDRETLRERRRSLTGGDWTWLTQVHGATVVSADDDAAGAEADAVVTRSAGVRLAAHTADCVPVALIAANGALGVVHAGWRGLLAGVVERAVAALDSDPAEVAAVIGPCIHGGCYEFGTDELEPLVDRFGSGVAVKTTGGGVGLDLVRCVRSALSASRVGAVDVLDHCTACDPRWFSHRARGDAGRQALVVWREVPSGDELDR